MSEQDSTSEEAGSAQRGNGYDPEAVRRFVARIELKKDEIDQVMSQARLDCGPMREDLEAIRKEATDAGIPRKALGAALRERQLRREADAIRGNLSTADQDRYDNIKLAIGDLGELGAAAIDKADPSKNGAAAH